MKHPLIRAGEGPAAAYARAHNQRVDAAQQLQRIANDSTDTTPHTIQAYGIGDVHQLRGIPAVGVKGGLGGAIRGTRPGDTR